ncbi:hypothetical protein A1O3_09285 [Capronia epimyces CBS 606.96]|uniref:SnoaL-like domain-containing protein n=1 Tax=Capronia epimyces CBS 606.96 TaxID=1182542 RepID=W9Y6S6_9EURO|nr:uncharacterized protein A1O3_09285 [Capronia epimyces CBS 606.96]EXJ78124.1 hypothetical protein A1O3_09285 [Capronia epimyces CBS 606.96]
MSFPSWQCKPFSSLFILLAFYQFLCVQPVGAATATASTTRHPPPGSVDCNANTTASTETSCPYPNQEQIYSIFNSLQGLQPNYTAFFEHVAENVDWTIQGTHPLAGRYQNKTVLESTFKRITSTAVSGTSFAVSIIHIVGGGLEQWSVQELEVKGVCQSGLVFDNRYAWVTRWGPGRIIVEARAYLDSALVATALIQNELGQFTYSDPRPDIIPWTSLTPQELERATGFDSTDI